MIRTDIRETTGQYLSGLMDAEPTHFIGRKRYEHHQGDVNHRNVSYDRNFTLKGIGEIDVKVPTNPTVSAVCLELTGNGRLFSRTENRADDGVASTPLDSRP